MSIEPQPANLTSSQQRQLSSRFRQIMQHGTLYEDDGAAPPVDLDLLRKYVRDEATTDEAQVVELMVRKYRSWVAEMGRLED